MSITRINTNESEIMARRNLGIVERDLSGTLERLSSGLRINKSADDPSGMQLATNYQRQIQGARTAMQNAEDALNMLRYADEALGSIGDIMLRMSELALRASNEAAITEDTQNDLSYEFKLLKQSIESRARAVVFNGRNLLAGSYAGRNSYAMYHITATGAGVTRWISFRYSAGIPNSYVFAFSNGLKVQIGPDNATMFQLTIAFDRITLTALGLTGNVKSARTFAGYNTNMIFGGFGTVNLNTSATISTTLTNNADYALRWKDALDDSMDTVGDIRASIGVLEMRLEGIIDSLFSEEANLSAAKSRIMDADMAQEISDLVRYQVIAQAGIAALAQANVQPQHLLTLLGVVQ